jgi:hypothetical protein
MSTCRDCYATIAFVRLDTGKPIPVDPVPYPDKGNVAARRLPDGDLVGHVISAAKPLQPGQERYLPHRATCHPDKPRVTHADRTPALFETGSAT